MPRLTKINVKAENAANPDGNVYEQLAYWKECHKREAALRMRQTIELRAKLAQREDDYAELKKNAKIDLNLANAEIEMLKGTKLIMQQRFEKKLAKKHAVVVEKDAKVKALLKDLWKWQEKCATLHNTITELVLKEEEETDVEY
jgi:Holliday junction resolvasome RuvABC ATP-dependent DNA helicase subunit